MSDITVINLTPCASAFFSDLPEIDPETYNLVIREWTNCHLKRPNSVNKGDTNRGKVGSHAVLRVSMAYNQSRLKHPVLKFVEYLNIILKFVVLWWHICIKPLWGVGSELKQ